jgi:hypothetical protein
MGPLSLCLWALLTGGWRPDEVTGESRGWAAGTVKGTRWHLRCAIG